MTGFFHFRRVAACFRPPRFDHLGQRGPDGEQPVSAPAAWPQTRTISIERTNQYQEVCCDFWGTGSSDPAPHPRRRFFSVTVVGPDGRDPREAFPPPPVAVDPHFAGDHPEYPECASYAGTSAATSRSVRGDDWTPLTIDQGGIPQRVGPAACQHPIRNRWQVFRSTDIGLCPCRTNQALFILSSHDCCSRSRSEPSFQL